MRTLQAIAVVLALTLAPVAVWAHSGGTDANGCHTDSRTGTRHCHNGGSGGGGGGGGGSVDTGVVVAVVAGLLLLGVVVLVSTSNQSGAAGPRVSADASPDDLFDLAPSRVQVRLGGEGVVIEW